MAGQPPRPPKAVTHAAAGPGTTIGPGTAGGTEPSAQAGLAGTDEKRVRNAGAMSRAGFRTLFRRALDQAAALGAVRSPAAA